MTTASPFFVSAPGRVCLFGEHSDYLGLQVLPAAIDRTIDILVSPRRGSSIRVLYVNLNETDMFDMDKDVTYRHRREYLRSAFNVLTRQGMKPSGGADLTVSGNIPIAAGLSSSSALTVASVIAFAYLSGTQLNPDRTAQLAFQAEVQEFGESGGMMDHFASAYGGLIHLDCGHENRLTKLPAQLNGLVIGDSQEKKKDTVGDLISIRRTVEEGYRRLADLIPGFDQRVTPLEPVEKRIDKLPESCRLMTMSTIRNRDLTIRAMRVLNSATPDPKTVGLMLDEHHSILRDGLHRSTPRIEAIISAAKSAGALGCKINGSGGGGTMLAYAPGREKEVADAISQAGGIPYPVKIGRGAFGAPIKK